MADTVQEIAFRYAVDRVNVDRDILPRSRLTAQIERIPQQDSFYASKQGEKNVPQEVLKGSRGFVIVKILHFFKGFARVQYILKILLLISSTWKITFQDGRRWKLIPVGGQSSGSPY